MMRTVVTRTRSTRWGRALPVVALLTTATLGLAACDDPADTSATESTDPGPTQPEVESASFKAQPEEDVEPLTTVPAPQATEPGTLDEQLVEDILVAAWSSLEDPEANIDLTEILADSALEDIENQRQELGIEEMRMSGTPAISSVEINEGSTDVEATANVCVDASEVRVLDENGAAVNDNATDTELRSLTIVSFSQDGGQWRMTDRTYPDDSSC